MKTGNGILEWRIGGGGAIREVFCFAGVCPSSFQSGRGLPQSKTLRRFGAAGFSSDDTGLRQSFGVLWKNEQRELMQKWLELDVQRLGLKRRAEMRIYPHWTVFIRIFFRGAKNV